MSKNNEKSKAKLKYPSNLPEKNQKENKTKHKLLTSEEEKNGKNKISIKDQNAKDKFEYNIFLEKTKLLSDYYAPNIELKNLNITLRCLSCYKIPKIRFNYPNFKVFVSCPKHRKSLSYQEFLEKGYNNDLINVPCCKCKKTHSYMVRGSYFICLQCNKVFCPECSTKKEKCEAYNNNTNSKKEKKNIYINYNEEQQSKTHILIKLDIYDNKCHLHQVNQFSLYCLDCQCELCSRCQENHTKGHKIRSLSKYTVNNKFIEECLNRVKSEKDNIEFVEEYISCFNDYNEEEKKMKKDLLYYIAQDKFALDIKECILKSYREKKFIYNAIRNVRKLKFPWLNGINPIELEKLKNKNEIYKNLNLYLIEGNLNDEQSMSNDSNSQDDSDASDDDISFFSLSQNNNHKIKDDYKVEKINICFNNHTENENEEKNMTNTSKKSKKKVKNEKKSGVQTKNLSEMKNFLCEQDEITIECLLGLKNSNFALGLLSGDLNIYKNDPLNKNFSRILKISEHKSGINSLCELPNNSILTASSDRFLKKICLLNNSTSYKVEYIFNMHTSSVYKGIKLKNNNIVSCGINDYLILWVNNEEKENINIDNNNIINTNDSNKYKPIQFIDAGEGISDIIEIRAGSFISASDTLQFWNLCSENTTNNSYSNKKLIINANNIINNDGYNNKNIINKNNESKLLIGVNKINKTQIKSISNNNNISNTSNISESSNVLFNSSNKALRTHVKIYINNNEYYERKGFLEIKTSGSNCLCKLSTKYLLVILSEELKGNIAMIEIDKIECINIIQISNCEISSISNFYKDSILISYTEKTDEGYVVFLKQYELSRIEGLIFVAQKMKKLSDYYLKKKDNKKEKIDEKNGIGNDNKINIEYSKRIKEEINCMTYTTGGLLICTGKIESPEKSNLIGEIDLFI